jgi:hypothetical protein
LVVRPISGHLKGGFEERGEFTLVLEGSRDPEGIQLERPSPAQLLREMGYMTNTAQVTRRDAIRTLGQRYGLSNKEVFNMLEEAKK